MVSEVESAASVEHANVQVSDGLLLSSTITFPTLVRCSFWNRIQSVKFIIVATWEHT